MFLPILLPTPASFNISERTVEIIFEALAERVDIPQHGTVNIAFLPDEEVQRLNREYRGIDKVTDVLSFHYFEDFSDLTPEDIAGEIILSETRVIEQAREYGNSDEAELAKLIIHSALHLLGYDHETDDEYEDMRAEEVKIEEVLKEKTGIVIL